MTLGQTVLCFAGVFAAIFGLWLLWRAYKIHFQRCPKSAIGKHEWEGVSVGSRYGDGAFRCQKCETWL